MFAVSHITRWGNVHCSRYNQVVDVCALRPDLEMLPGGDETEIGEKVRLDS